MVTSVTRPLQLRSDLCFHSTPTSWIVSVILLYVINDRKMNMKMENLWNDIWSENLSTERKTCPVPLWLPQIPNEFSLHPTFVMVLKDGPCQWLWHPENVCLCRLLKLIQTVINPSSFEQFISSCERHIMKMGDTLFWAQMRCYYPSHFYYIQKYWLLRWKAGLIILN
jgi:hypothetical protein